MNVFLQELQRLRERLTEGEDAPVEHTPVEEEIVNEEMAVESVEESKSEEPQPEVNEQHMLAEQEIAPNG